jgi:hypothetical protein
MCTELAGFIKLLRGDSERIKGISECPRPLLFIATLGERHS